MTCWHGLFIDRPVTLRLLFHVVDVFIAAAVTTCWHGLFIDRTVTLRLWFHVVDILVHAAVDALLYVVVDVMIVGVPFYLKTHNT